MDEPYAIASLSLLPQYWEGDRHWTSLRGPLHTLEGPLCATASFVPRGHDVQRSWRKKKH